MTVKSLGSISVGSISLGTAMVMPIIAGYSASLNAKLVDVSAVLALSAGITPVDPVKYGQMLITQAEAWIKQIPDMLKKLPAASVSMKADLLKQQATIVAQIALIGTVLGKIQAALSSGGIEAYSFSGDVSRLPSELAPYLNQGNGHAVVFVARDPAAWAALSTVLYTG